MDNSAVNSQITDSVTQVNTEVSGDVPAVPMGDLLQATGQALSIAAHDAMNAEQQSKTTEQASTRMGVEQVYSIDTSIAVAADHLLTERPDQ